MNKILLVTLMCVAVASAATKTKSGASKRGFGIGTHDAHPEGKKNSGKMRKKFKISS